MGAARTKSSGGQNLRNERGPASAIALCEGAIPVIFGRIRHDGAVGVIASA